MGGKNVQEEIKSLMQTVDTLQKRVEALEKQKNFFKISINWKERLFSTFCFSVSILFCDYILIPFIDWLLYLF